MTDMPIYIPIMSYPISILGIMFLVLSSRNKLLKALEKQNGDIITLKNDLRILRQDMSILVHRPDSWMAKDIKENILVPPSSAESSMSYSVVRPISQCSSFSINVPNSVVENIKHLQCMMHPVSDSEWERMTPTEKLDHIRSVSQEFTDRLGDGM